MIKKKKAKKKIIKKKIIKNKNILSLKLNLMSLILFLKLCKYKLDWIAISLSPN